MESDNKYQAKIEEATPATPEELKSLEEKYGFSYRQAIGELIYVLVTCRPDISYPLIKLSQYSTKPSSIHFAALQQLFHYLKATATDGIHYWRNQPNLQLPHIPHQPP